MFILFNVNLSSYYTDPSPGHSELFEARLREWRQRAANTPKPLEDFGGIGAIDLCCGQGALVVALAEEGIHLDRLYVADDDPVAGLMMMETVEFLMEHPAFSEFIPWRAVAHMFDTWGDIRGLRHLDLNTLGRIDVGAGGPPCQPFSRANRGARGWDDPRAWVFVEVVDVWDRFERAAEDDGRWFCFLVENVRPAPHLVGCKAEMDALTGVTGVEWDSGSLIASARSRLWFTNAPYYAAPVGAPRLSTLTGVLQACGGHHVPRIASVTDQFNTAGEPVVVTATVMASEHTRANMPPPNGTGTALHHNVVTNELESLYATERFGVMSWPPEIAARAMARGIEHAKVCHSIGNSMAVVAVRHWIRHWRHLLPPREEPDDDPWDGRHSQDPHVSGDTILVSSASYSSDELSDHNTEWSSELSGGGDSDPEGADAQIARGAEEPCLPEANTAMDNSRIREHQLWEEEGEPHEEGDPQVEQHGFAIPEEEGFVAASQSKTRAAETAARLREAAEHFRAAEFDPVPSEEELRDGVRRVMREIRKECATPPGERVVPPMDEVAAEILKIRDECLDPERFQASRYQLHAAAWEEMCLELHRMGLQDEPVTKPQLGILRSLREGVKPQFWDIARGFDEGHRQFGKRFRAIRRELAAMPGIGEAKADAILKGKCPPRQHFKNRPSMEAHHGYVVETVVDLLRCGAARIWAEVPEHITKGLPPEVISPLSVAIREKDGKKRLCIDIRYLNLWLKHLSVKFDSVRDLAAMVDRMQLEGATEVVVCCTDMKSGYFHVPIAEDCWKYFCFEVEGVVCCYTCLNFGFAQSPRFYCAAEGLKHEAYRKLGVSLAEYIDDSARPYRNRAESLAVERRLLQLGTLLGGYYSFGQLTRGPNGEVFFSKMALWPGEEVEFLGFLLDLVRRVIAVPEAKLAYIERRIREWLAQGDLSPRDMARFAGLLVSIQPAIPFSKGLARDALRACVGAINWDEAFMPPPALRVVMQWLLDHMRAWNGTHWYTYPAGLRIMGDYSPTGTGGVIASVSLMEGDEKLVWRSAPKLLPIEVVSNFSQEDFDAIQAGSMSSVRGELVAALHLVIVALDEAPDTLIRGRTLAYITDGLAAIQALMRMYSPVAEIHALVMELHARVLSRGGRLEGGWVPREYNVLADFLSKVKDPSAWRLCWPVAKQVWKSLLSGTHYARPDIDAFADPHNKMCQVFFSRWPCPGARAVDAMLQGEIMSRVDAATGRKPLVHMNPPWCMWPDVVRLIRHWRINCVLIYPEFRGAGFAEIEALPLVRGPLKLPRRKNLFIPGVRVPAKDLGKARFKSRAALVLWDD